jgi:hypothetical protein
MKRPSAYRTRQHMEIDCPYWPPDSHRVPPSASSPWVNPRPGCTIVRSTLTRKNRTDPLSWPIILAA